MNHNIFTIIYILLIPTDKTLIFLPDEYNGIIPVG